MKRSVKDSATLHQGGPYRPACLHARTAVTGPAARDVGAWERPKKKQQLSLRAGGGRIRGNQHLCELQDDHHDNDGQDDCANDENPAHFRPCRPLLLQVPPCPPGARETACQRVVVGAACACARHGGRTWYLEAPTSSSAPPLVRSAVLTIFCSMVSTQVQGTARHDLGARGQPHAVARARGTKKPGTRPSPYRRQCPARRP